MRTRDIAVAALLRPERTPVVHGPTINIEQQPHDAADAARLLGELEKEAQAKIIEAVRVENCPIDCVVHAHWEAISDDMVMVAVFKINGHQLSAEHRVAKRNYNRDIGATFKGLRDKVAEVIAQEILAQPFGAMHRR